LSLTDEELVSRIRDRDPAAFQIVVETHFQAIAAYTNRMLADPSEAEDIVQEVFIRLWTRADNWQSGKARLSTWLHSIAHNLCIDHFRKHKRVVGSEMLPETIGGEEPEQNLTAETNSQHIRTAISSLPERQRSALVLCHYQGLSNKEAALIMEVSTEALESLLARGRRSLRDKLAGKEVDNA